MSSGKRRNYAIRREYRQKLARHKVRSVKTPRSAVPSWARIEPIPRNRLVPGTVVWAHIDFRDGTGEKARPAVVVDVRGTEVVVLPGTTSARRYALRDHVEVRDLDDAGLRRPTGISTMPLSVDRIDLTAISGSLSPHDHQRIVEAPSRTRGQADVAV